GVGGPNPAIPFNPVSATGAGQAGMEGPGGVPPRFANDDQDAAAEAATEQTRTALRRPLPEVNFQQVALSDAIAFLQDVSALDIYVDWKAAEAAGITRDVQITLRLKNVPGVEVLRLTLREASPELR